MQRILVAGIRILDLRIVLISTCLPCFDIHKLKWATRGKITFILHLGIDLGAYDHQPLLLISWQSLDRQEIEQTIILTEYGYIICTWTISTSISDVSISVGRRWSVSARGSPPGGLWLDGGLEPLCPLVAECLAFLCAWTVYLRFCGEAPQW